MELKKNANFVKINNQTFPCFCENYNEALNTIDLILDQAFDPGISCEIDFKIDPENPFSISGKIQSSSTKNTKESTYSLSVKLKMDSVQKKIMKQVFASPEDNLINLFDTWGSETKGLKNKVS